MRDENQFAVPSVHVVDDEKLKDTLAHPVPPGGNLPDLNLADSPGFSVASGKSFQTMPEPVKPDIVWPTLFGSPECGGYDPANPTPAAPNLAGCGGGVDFPADGAIHTPDYGMPDFASLNRGLIGTSEDLAQAKINYSYGSEFAADPANPDLNDYNKPMGLDIHNLNSDLNGIFKPDPQTGDLIDYEVPGGLHVLDHPLDPDPQLPDLQDPQFTLAIKMNGRPGDMDPSALDIMHQAPTYGQVKDVAYDLSFMVQPGSTRRARHMDALMHGLDGDL